MSCNCCASVDLSQCQDGIFLNGNFTPSTNYTVVVTGKAGKYEAVYLSDLDGIIEIDPADYPPGLFNPYAGPLKIEVYIDLVKQDFVLCQRYDCVELTITNGNFVNNQIGVQVLASGE